MAALLLKIITPEGEAARAECDSVGLVSRDDPSGSGGGGIGIRRGHIPAVIALRPGSLVTAKLGGKPLLSVRVTGGFASVRSDTVTVISTGAEEAPPSR